MRKNTLIKLLAVLAMCFLIGAALVSCGEKEDDNADVKTIVGVDFADGKLVIAYSDGTSANVALPEAKECEHKNVVKIITEKHAVDAQGNVSNDEILNVCNDCHEAWVVYAVEHIPVDFVDEKAPTCTEDGYTTTKKCAECGIPLDEFTTIKPAIGHNYEGAAMYWISGNSCVGGVKGQDCLNGCGTVKETTVATADDTDFDGIHTVNVWYTSVAPTATTEGQIYGICTLDRCGETVHKTIGTLPDKASNDEYTFDTNSDMFTQCGDGADYRYVHNETDLEYHVIIAGSATVQHELNGKKMVSVEQVAAGKEFESAYILEDHPGIITFANHPVTCYEAALAHFICTAVHDGGAVCGKDISVYVKHDHTTVDNAWVTVPGQEPACKVAVKQTQVCKADNCGMTVERELPLQNHSYKYTSDVLYTKNGENYVAGFDVTAEANIAKVPYYQGVCEYCGALEYKTVTNYKYEEVKAATCQADGLGKVTYNKASDGAVVTKDVVLAQFAHKTTVNGAKVEIVEGKEDIKVIIYNADHADYKDLVKELDNVTFSETTPVLGYIHCDCTCEGCELHDVTVWVQKLGEDGPATKAF